MNKRIVLITLLIILFSAGIYIYKEYNRKPARLNNLPAVVNINADTLISQFALNEAEANKKYLGKEIYIAFIEDDIIKVYYHDEVVNSLYSESSKRMSPEVFKAAAQGMIANLRATMSNEQIIDKIKCL